MVCRLGRNPPEPLFVEFNEFMELFLQQGPSQIAEGFPKADDVDSAVELDALTNVAPGTAGRN
jgi:hypothetical protein